MIAFLALLGGAAATAFAPILVRLSDVSPTASAFWRVALAVPVLWGWALLREYRQRALSDRDAGADATANAGAEAGAAPRTGLPRAALIATLVAGLFFAADLGAWHVAIAWTSVANATLEANFAPIFVTLGAWMLWRQKPRPAFLLALAITMGGAVLVVSPNMHIGGRALQGDLLGTLTGMFYAGYMLSIKSAAGTISTVRIMAISTTVSALALAPYAALTAERLLPLAATGWLVLAALAALYAWLLLAEPMQPLQMAGGAIVLAGIYLARRAS